jgi:hypothetical protein
MFIWVILSEMLVGTALSTRRGKQDVYTKFGLRNSIYIPVVRTRCRKILKEMSCKHEKLMELA